MGVRVIAVAAVLSAWTAVAMAAEPEAREPVGVDQAQATGEPSSGQVQQTIQDYVKQITDEEGDFAIEDEETGNLRTLTLEQVTPQVGKNGEAYYSCAQMKDVDTGDALDVDFDVERVDGELDVVDVRIHKVNGTERYTYDANHNIVPVSHTASGT